MIKTFKCTRCQDEFENLTWDPIENAWCPRCGIRMKPIRWLNPLPVLSTTLPMRTDIMPGDPTGDTVQLLSHILDLINSEEIHPRSEHGKVTIRIERISYHTYPLADGEKEVYSENTANSEIDQLSEFPKLRRFTKDLL